MATTKTWLWWVGVISTAAATAAIELRANRVCDWFELSSNCSAIFHYRHGVYTRAHRFDHHHPHWASLLLLYFHHLSHKRNTRLTHTHIYIYLYGTSIGQNNTTKNNQKSTCPPLYMGPGKDGSHGFDTVWFCMYVCVCVCVRVYIYCRELLSSPIQHARSDMLLTILMMIIEEPYSGGVAFFLLLLLLLLLQ